MPTRARIVAALIVLAPLAARAQDGSPRVVISDAGAVGDGVTLNTPAIQKAIDRLAGQGGGTVVVPAGRFLTGAVFLKPRVNLHLEANGELLGSPRIDDYPAMPTRIEGHTQVWRPALVNADHCDHLRITGPGMIRGGGKPYWEAFRTRFAADAKTRNLDVDRPRNLFIRDSADVRVSGVSLRDSGFWNLHLYRCRDTTVENADIRTPSGAPSTDGIDIDSCQDVTVRGCYISVDDDDIALKGSKGPRADRDADSPAVERIHVVGCTFAGGHGVVTLGSEACHVKGVLVEDCKVIDPPGADGAGRHNIVVRLKLRPDTPQHYEDVHFRNITLDFHGTLISIEPWTQYFDLAGQPAPTQQVENVTVENVSGTANGFGRIAAPKATVQDVTLRNIDLKLESTKVNIEKVRGLHLESVKVNGLPMAMEK